jgi:hypothetical protein
MAQTGSGKRAAWKAIEAAHAGVIVWPGPKPWDPIDEADRTLGYQFPYVSPRRAYEIRREIERGIPRQVYANQEWRPGHG